MIAVRILLTSGTVMPNNNLPISEVWINKDDISQTKVVECEFNTQSLGVDQVLLKTDSFGFSANNITYALLGDKMGYWGFFPADEGWGKVPVWGFATVVASIHPNVVIGEKVFGYLPMASHLVITAGKTSASHFYDVDVKRKSISPVYDNYLRCAKDPGYQLNREAWQLNYRPLFMTSFVLDDFVGEQLVPDVQNIIVTSASSKTAYGTAFLLQQHKAERGQHYNVVGLTSKANKVFVDELGCYDQVIEYGDIDQLSAQGNSWLLDFSGNKLFIVNLQKQLSSYLTRMLFIGATDVQSQEHKPEGHLPGEVFFAPAQVKKRTHEWGAEGFSQKYTQAWQQFSRHIEGKVSVANYRGVTAIEAVYQQGLVGTLDNRKINVLEF
ncbi:MAG: hypothetical protein ACI81A_002823 [Paraglaciecola sp.]|jgi:hypothetical protein